MSNDNDYHCYKHGSCLHRRHVCMNVAHRLGRIRDDNQNPLPGNHVRLQCVEISKVSHTAWATCVDSTPPKENANKNMSQTDPAASCLLSHENQVQEKQQFPAAQLINFDLSHLPSQLEDFEVDIFIFEG